MNQEPPNGGDPQADPPGPAHEVSEAETAPMETSSSPADSSAAAGPLLHFEEGEALEEHDRKHAGPGGEPACPRCGADMVRSVEQHRGPRSDDSPFRVRLVCGSADCGAWTAYNW